MNKSRRLMGRLALLFAFLLSGCGEGIKSGKEAFQRCISCHSMKSGVNYTGPSLAGVLNRKAGTAVDFNYSSAVKASNIVWTVENLDTWLTNPQAFIPGTKMGFEGISDRKVREELIAILKEKTAHPTENTSLP